MAKVTFSTDIQSISGKLCKKEGVIYSVNKQTGKTYRSDRHVTNYANTEAQQQVKTAFTQKTKTASAWWNQNKPATKDAKGTEAYQAVMKAYKSQSKIGNPYSFLRSLVTDDLKVILGGKDLTGGIVPNTPSQGTGTDQGGSGGPLE